jgi:hypothetical protein
MLETCHRVNNNLIDRKRKKNMNKNRAFSTHQTTRTEKNLTLPSVPSIHEFENFSTFVYGSLRTTHVELTCSKPATYADKIR